MRQLDCMEVYEDAGFYDLEFANRNFEIPFFVKNAVTVGGPVLEVACGTSRITLPIVRTGIEITGLDVASPMLERAQKKDEAEHLSIFWLKRDCRQIDINQVFTPIFSPPMPCNTCMILNP